MGRAIKWGAGILVALVVILVIAIYIILSSYDFNDLKPQIAKAVKDATGRELTIQGDIDLSIGLTPSLIVPDIKFQNAPWGSRADLAKIARLEVQLALLPLIRKNIEVKRFILLEPDILIETNKKGKSNLEFKKAEKAKDEKKEETSAEGLSGLPAIAVNQLEIKNCSLVYKDGKTGKEQKVIIENLEAATEGTESPITINLKGRYNDEPFNMEGLLGPIAALTDPDKPWALETTIAALDVDVNLNGSIKDPLSQKGIDMGFNIKTSDFGKISKMAGASLPPIEPVEISGRASDKGTKAYNITDFKLLFAKNLVSGSIAADISGKIPQVTVALSSKKLDLRPLFPKDKSKKKPEKTDTKKTESPKKVFPSTPLDLKPLKQVNASVKFRAEKILAPQLAVNNFQTDILLKNGRLSVKPLKAVIGGGQLSGNVSINPKGKTAVLSTSMKMDGFGIGDMLKELEVTDIMDGDIDLDINLKGRGESVAGIMAGMNGYLSMVMGRGKIHNKYINLLGGDISSGVMRLLNPVKEKQDYTAINCMVTRFDIRKGIADTTALVFDTERMSVVGDGLINLKTEKLDMAINPSPKEGTAGLSLSLGELAKPFKLAGTLAKPSLGIDPTKAAIMLGKAIGGAALFGPAGIAASLLSTKGGDENPCVTALQAAKTGGKPAKKKKEEKKPTDVITDSIPGVGKKLKGLFGN